LKNTGPPGTSLPLPEPLLLLLPSKKNLDLGQIHAIFFCFLFFSGILFSLPKILPAVSFQFGLIALRSSRGQYFDIASRLSLTPQVDLKAQNLISFLFLSALCASQASLFLSVFHFFFLFRSLPKKCLPIASHFPSTSSISPAPHPLGPRLTPQKMCSQP
jgi:hypothetical protein